MKVQIEALHDHGVPNRERLVLRCVADADTANYVVLSTYRGLPEHVIAGSLPSFWFPSREVASGDRIVLFTGSGEQYQEENDEGGTDFIFYWGQETTLWGYQGAAVVVLEATAWKSAVVEVDQVES